MEQYVFWIYSSFASEENKTYVIDELDRCLHPSLTYKFVDTFLQLAAKRNIQLIVTTHESRYWILICCDVMKSGL